MISGEFLTLPFEIYDCNHNKISVLGEHLPVAQNHFFDITHAQSVHHSRGGGYTFLEHSCFFVISFYYDAVVKRHDDIFLERIPTDSATSAFVLSIK